MGRKKEKSLISPLKSIALALPTRVNKLADCLPAGPSCCSTRKQRPRHGDEASDTLSLLDGGGDRSRAKGGDHGQGRSLDILVSLWLAEGSL